MGTFEEELKNTILGGEIATRVALCEVVSAKTSEELDSLDSRLYSVGKRWENYGTWKVTLWVNSYWFGEKVAELLNSIAITTHDEDKVFTISDFADEITEKITDWAYEYWGDELWNEED